MDTWHRLHYTHPFSGFQFSENASSLFLIHQGRSPEMSAMRFEILTCIIDVEALRSNHKRRSETYIVLYTSTQQQAQFISFVPNPFISLWRHNIYLYVSELVKMGYAEVIRFENSLTMLDQSASRLSHLLVDVMLCSC